MRIERKYWPVWMLVVAMFFSWSAWGIVFNKMSPFVSPGIAIPMFYLTIVLSISLTFFTFDVLFRLAFFPRQTVLFHTYASLRQGAIVGLVFLGILVFLQYQILTWWIGGMISAMGLLIEAFFWSQGKKKRASHHENDTSDETQGMGF